MTLETGNLLPCHISKHQLTPRSLLLEHLGHASLDPTADCIALLEAPPNYRHKFNASSVTDLSS